MIGIGLFLLPKFLSPDLSNSLTDAYELLRCFEAFAPGILQILFIKRRTLL